MSATRDPSQKHTFVYSNLYHLYQKGKVAAHAANVPAPTPAAPVAKAETAPELTRTGLATGKIIKAEEMQAAVFGTGPVGLRVARHEPPRLLGKHIEANRSVPMASAALAARRGAIDGLRDNLKQLQGLHERLRFMLKEIEELTQND